ncbi:efflux RND transporter permease subunit [Geotalea toluenoxydans]
MIRKIAEKIIRYRVQVLLVIVALTVFFAWHLKDIKIAFGGGDIVPPNHPYVKLTERMVEKYGGEHLVEIAIQVKKGDVLDPVNLAKVYRIDQKLREMQGVVTSKIISVASRKFSRVNFAYDELGYSTLHFEKYQDLVRKINDGDSKEATAFREEVLNNDMISGTIVSPDRKRTLILAGFRYEEDYRYIFETLQKIVNEEKDANTEFFLAGRPIMLGYIDSAFRGILVVFAIAVLVMVVTLYLDFRTIRGVLLPLSSGLIGVVWGLGFMSLLGHRIDVLGVTIPFLLVALAHGHSVQILSRYYYEYANGRNREEAAVESMIGLLKPMTTSIFADAVGLFVLILMPFRSIQSMALVGTAGIVAICVGCFVLIPVSLALLPPMKQSSVNREESWFGPIFERLAKFSLGKGKVPILALTGVVLVIALVGAFKVRVGELQSGSPDFWPNAPYNKAEKVVEQMTGGNLYWINIEGDRTGALYDAKVISDINALQRHLGEMPEVGYSISYVDALKKVNAAMHENDPRWEILPNDTASAGELIGMIGGSEGYDESKDMFTKDYKSGTIAVFLKDRKPETLKNVISGTRDFLKKNQTSDIRFELPGGTAGIYSAINEEIEKNEFLSVVIVVVACLILTVLAFKSWLAALIIFVPLLIGKAITMAFMGYGGIGFFIYTLPVVTLGFGLGIDFSLYILARFKEEISESGDFVTGYIKALGTSGRAVLFTGLTMTGGLLTLCLSEMRFQAILGSMLSVVVMANTIIALLFFPVLLSVIKPKFLFQRGE